VVQWFLVVESVIAIACLATTIYGLVVQFSSPTTSDELWFRFFVF
jgi:hypothetical protein